MAAQFALTGCNIILFAHDTRRSLMKPTNQQQEQKQQQHLDLPQAKAKLCLAAQAASIVRLWHFTHLARAHFTARLRLL